MLDLETFGLHKFLPSGKIDDEATQKEIAKTQGLVAIPLGLCQILTSIAIYAPVTKKLGEVPVLVFAGVLACISFGSYGFWIEHLWQLMVLQGLGGVCFGLLIPSVFPLIARYSSVHYRKKMAVCQAVPMMGMQIAWTFGQNIMSPVLDTWKGEEGLKYCWIIVAGCILSFTILISIACILVDMRAPKKNTLTSEQRKVILAQGDAMHPVEDTDKFIDAMCGRLRETLTERRGQLWNGTAQFLYREGLEKSLKEQIPDFHRWSETHKGEEYLREMYNLLLNYPEELEEFSRNFPHIASNNPPNASSYGAGLAAGSGMNLQQRDALPHSMSADSMAFTPRPEGGLPHGAGSVSLQGTMGEPLAPGSSAQ